MSLSEELHAEGHEGLLMQAMDNGRTVEEIADFCNIEITEVEKVKEKWQKRKSEESQMENEAKKTEIELYDGCNDAREEAILLMLKFGIEEKKILNMGYGRKKIDKMREVLLDTQWQHGFLAGRAEVILKLYDSGMTDKDIMELGYEYEDLYNAGQHQAKWEIANRLLGRGMTLGDVVDCCVTDKSEAKALSDKLVKFDKSL